MKLAMHRAMYRLRTRKWVEERAYMSAGAIFVGDQAYSKLRNNFLTGSNAPVDVQMKVLERLHGVPVHRSILCNAHWESTGNALRSHAIRFFRRHGVRR